MNENDDHDDVQNVLTDTLFCFYREIIMQYFSIVNLFSVVPHDFICVLRLCVGDGSKKKTKRTLKQKQNKIKKTKLTSTLN